LTRIDDVVGLIGLGSIGQVYADHLLAGLDELLVFDVDRTAVAAAADRGATECPSPAELASRCGLIVLALPNPPAVEQVLLGEDGVVAGARPGTIVVDLSTVSPDTSRTMHERAAEKGIHYLDAPVSGGKPMSGGVHGALAGNVTFMVGGDEAAFEDARPVMELLGEVFLHLGPAGSGSTVKLISNLLSGVYALVTAEAFALGAAAGFTPERLLEVFKETDAKCYFMTDYLLPRYFREEFDPGFSVALQLKDHRLAAELGHEVQVPLLFNGLAVQLYELMIANGLADRDVTEAIPFLASIANVEPAGTAA
jgi:3-hydroxyisobutyrate dehydrogenase-like beta-hydroxyacid dehydrogenase